MVVSGEDALDGVGEGGPGGGEVGEAAGAVGGEGVVDAAAAVDGFAMGGEGTVTLEVVEYGVDNAFAESDGGTGAVADSLYELVAVHLALLEEAEDEEFGDAVHEVGVGVAWGHGETIHRGSRY
jgi:hypothetical protein